MQNVTTASEQRISLTKAAKLTPGNPHAATIWRWCRKGIRARNGERIHLEHLRFGGKMFTTPESLERFARRLVDADSQYFEFDGQTVIRRSPVRNADLEKIEAELATDGI